MLSDNKRLSLLVRKNSGKLKLHDYKQFFKGFNLKKLEYIELEQADEILEKIKHTFSSIPYESEMIGNDTSQNSKLVDEMLNLLSITDTCYIFTNDVEECGMFKTDTK